MDFSFLAPLKGLLSPIAKASWKSLRVDLYRRNVASGKKLNPDIVSSVIDEALDILADKSNGVCSFLSVKLHRTLSNATPIFKSSPELSIWINNENNREAIKSHVLNALNGIQDDNPRENSRDLFVSITRALRSDADRYIDMACEYAAYSLLAYIDPNDKLVLDAISRTGTNILKSIEDTRLTLSAGIQDINDSINKKIPISLVDPHAKNILNTIAQRSPFSESDTISELRKLVDQIEHGDLTYVSVDTASNIYDALVVALCNEDQHADANIWQQKSKTRKPEKDHSVNEARIKLCEGNAEKALQDLRGNESPDALSFSIITIARQYSIERAKEYYDQKIQAVERMTPRGLHSLAMLAATSNDWPFAEKILSQATEEQIKNYPCLLSIRGVFRARMCCSFQHENPAVLVAPLNPHLVRFSDEPDKVGLRIKALNDLSTFLTQFASRLNIRGFNFKVQHPLFDC